MGLRLLFPPSLGELKATARAETLADILSKTLGGRVSLKVARTYGDLEYRVMGELFELAWAPPGICAKAFPTARAVYKAVRGGRSSYRAAIVTRAAGGVSLSELSGKRAAWVDPLSAAGYLLPRAHLRRQGIEPDQVLLDYWFVGSYRAALMAVLSNEADITSIYTRSTDEAQLREILREHVGNAEHALVPIAFTGETPGDGLIFSSRLTPAQVDRVMALASAPPEPDHQRSLLLEVLDADELVPVEPGEYDALTVPDARALFEGP